MKLHVITCGLPSSNALKLSRWFIASVDPVSSCAYHAGASCIAAMPSPRNRILISVKWIQTVLFMAEDTTFLSNSVRYIILFIVSRYFVFKPALMQRFTGIILQYNMDVCMYSDVKRHYIQLICLQVSAARISFWLTSASIFFYDVYLSKEIPKGDIYYRCQIFPIDWCNV